jgi:hypothetical protein
MPSKSKSQKALVKAKLASLKQGRPTPVIMHPPTYYLEHAREYPIYGCWIDRLWKEHSLARVVLARQQSPECVLYGSFLVDPLCLGVKDAFFRTDIRSKRFPKDLLKLCGDPEPCSVEFTHQLIYDAIEYAHRYGIEPHPDYNETSLVLDPPGTHPANADIEFGKDGKPFFISGPYDNVDQIIATLRRTAGDGNFDFLLGIGQPDLDEFEDELYNEIK